MPRMTYCPSSLCRIRCGFYSEVYFFTPDTDGLAQIDFSGNSCGDQGCAVFLNSIDHSFDRSDCSVDLIRFTVEVFTNGTLLFEQGQYERQITDIALR